MNINELIQAYNDKIEYDKVEKKNSIEIRLKCLYEDKDTYNYVYKTMTAKKFFENTTIKLTLSYIMGDPENGKLFGAINDPDKTSSDFLYKQRYGEYVFITYADITNLDSYLLRMFDFGFEEYHHIDPEIKITYYDSKGDIYNIKLPDFDSLFQNKEDAVEMMNYLIDYDVD
jgi:hypothetical protein